MGRMTGPYDLRFRERAVRAYDQGDRSYVEVAAIFGIDHRTLERWVALFRQTGSVAPRPRGGGQRSRVDVPLLQAVLAAKPDMTCGELAVAYNRRVPATRRVKWWTVWRALQRAGYVLKKNARGRRNRTTRTFSAPDARFNGGSARSTRTVWFVSMKPARTGR
jgi:transposase